MLFNSYIFILGFLPITLGLFHLFTRKGYFRTAIFILIVASLVFYAWWSPKYLLLLIALILFNFGTAKQIKYHRIKHPLLAKILLITGITVNLGVLCYYKYTNFFIDNLNTVLGLNIVFKELILPIGISFFTFQKIAFLVDVYKNKAEDFNLLDFSLFVMFFPQLIAGPIVHHSEVMPQFSRQNKVTLDSIKLGLTILIIGLAKKVILADTAAKMASPQFNAVAVGGHLDVVMAWGAALAYTAQLYFDFSAYSDMAIGIGLLFGIRMPVNFNSPYKSSSIIDFWRRWHMTLSRFLRDYLYFPLGGNKKGKGRRYINLMITMLLGGIWHGVGWTFLIWGALHGLYLIINHGWRTICERLNFKFSDKEWLIPKVGQILTFLAVVVSWVFFRSANFQTAMDILKSMIGIHGFVMPASLHQFFPQLAQSSSSIDSGIILLMSFTLLLITWLAPNTQELMSYHGPEEKFPAEPLSSSQFRWQPSRGWAIFLGSLFAVCFMMFLHVSEFIYFQF